MQAQPHSTAQLTPEMIVARTTGSSQPRHEAAYAATST
jgi:hypothetical protein